MGLFKLLNGISGILIFYLLSISLLSCNNDDFSPYSNLEPGLVTYCILDTRNEIQYVRVQNKYFNDNTKLHGGRTDVVLSENLGDGIFLRDTVLPGFSNYKIFYISNFVPKRNTKYRLTVRQDTLMQYSYTDIPDYSGISALIKMDTIYRPDGAIFVRWTFQAEFMPTAPKISCVKLFIEYQLLDENLNNKRIIEIPIEVGNIYKHLPLWELWEINEPIHKILGGTSDLFGQVSEKEYTLFTKVYPMLVANRNSNYYKTGSNGKIVISYPPEVMYFTLNELAKGYDRRRIRINRGFVVFYSVDENYYNNFIDRKEEMYSIRIDQSFEYTNFQNTSNNAKGYFCAVTADTSNFKIIEYFFRKFGFINGQK